MKQLSLSRLAAVACILCAASAGASAAQTSRHGSDPSRWYHGDSSEQQRMGILRKELSAAYADQQAACRHQPAGERASCLREARTNYRHDSANARELVANAPQSEVSERVVTTTPAGSGNGTEPGASAYGNSGAGATGSGQDQGAAPAKAPPESGSSMDNGSQNNGNGKVNGTTQSDTEDQSGTGTAPPIEH